MPMLLSYCRLTLSRCHRTLFIWICVAQLSDDVSTCSFCVVPVVITSSALQSLTNVCQFETALNEDICHAIPYSYLKAGRVGRGYLKA